MKTKTFAPFEVGSSEVFGGELETESDEDMRRLWFIPEGS